MSAMLNDYVENIEIWRKGEIVKQSSKIILLNFGTAYISASKFDQQGHFLLMEASVTFMLPHYRH